MVYPSIPYVFLTKNMYKLESPQYVLLFCVHLTSYGGKTIVGVSGLMDYINIVMPKR